MVNVFTGSVLTQTRPNGYANDAQQLPFKNLNPRAMTSPTALSGTTGACVSLVHGDVWDQFEGNDTKNVLKDDKLTVTGSRTELIKTNHQHTIVGTTNTTHIGVHHQVNISPRNDTFVHTRTEDHHQPEQIHQPTILTSIQEHVHHYYKFHHKTSSFWFTNVFAANFGFYPGLNLSYTTMEGKLGVLASKALVAENP